MPLEMPSLHANPFVLNVCRMFCDHIHIHYDCCLVPHAYSFSIGAQTKQSCKAQQVLARWLQQAKLALMPQWQTRNFKLAIRLSAVPWLYC